MLIQRIESGALALAYVGLGVGCLLVAREAFSLAWSAGKAAVQETPAQPTLRAAAR